MPGLPYLWCDRLWSDLVHVTHCGKDVNFSIVRHAADGVIQDAEKAASGRSIPAIKKWMVTIWTDPWFEQHNNCTYQKYRNPHISYRLFQRSGQLLQFSLFLIVRKNCNKITIISGLVLSWPGNHRALNCPSSSIYRNHLHQIEDYVSSGGAQQQQQQQKQNKTKQTRNSLSHSHTHTKIVRCCLMQ